MQVRCIDNTLQRDVLVEGKVYEQIGGINRDGYVTIDGFARQFSAARFVPVEEERESLAKEAR